MVPNTRAARVMRTALNANGGISLKADFITIKLAPHIKTTSSSKSSGVRWGFFLTRKIISDYVL